MYRMFCVLLAALVFVIGCSSKQYESEDRKEDRKSDNLKRLAEYQASKTGKLYNTKKLKYKNAHERRQDAIRVATENARKRRLYIEKRNEMREKAKEQERRSAAYRNIEKSIQQDKSREKSPYGTLTSTYKSGDYFIKTYKKGNTITSLMYKNGVLVDTTTHKSY